MSHVVLPPTTPSSVFPFTLSSLPTPLLNHRPHAQNPTFATSNGTVNMISPILRRIRTHVSPALPIIIEAANEKRGFQGQHKHLQQFKQLPRCVNKVETFILQYHRVRSQSASPENRALPITVEAPMGNVAQNEHLQHLPHLQHFTLRPRCKLETTIAQDHHSASHFPFRQMLSRRRRCGLGSIV
jgi:hypothetical protein